MDPSSRFSLTPGIMRVPTRPQAHIFNFPVSTRNCVNNVKEKPCPSKHVPPRPKAEPAFTVWGLQQHIPSRVQVALAVLNPWLSCGMRCQSVRPACSACLNWAHAFGPATPGRSSPLSPPFVCPIRTMLPSCCWPSWRAGTTARTRRGSSIT